MNKNVLGLILFSSLKVYSFEVNTHQAITRCAIQKNLSQCKTDGVENLETFMSKSGISTDNIYGSQFFDKYKYKGKDVTYTEYIKKAEKAIKDYQVEVNGTYKGMIEAGVILEDAIYHDTTLSVLGTPIAQSAGVGRFNNHFYAAQIANTKAECKKIMYPVAALVNTIRAVPLPGTSVLANTASTVVVGNVESMHTNKTLCGGLGERTDSIDWAFNKNVDLSLTNTGIVRDKRTNDYGLDDAFDYFKRSFSGKEDYDKRKQGYIEGNIDTRKKYQAKLFVSLGFLVHLLQDIHSPAHCRDGAHAKGDYLEIYGRYDGGFYLRNGSFSKAKNNTYITQAIRNMNMKKIMLDDNKFTTYEDFYRKEEDWVSNNFFSESHNSLESANSETGKGLTINNIFDSDTIFDSFNSYPSKDTTYEIDENNIISSGNTVPNIHGDLVGHTILNEQPIGLIDRGIFFDNEHMILPEYRLDYRNKNVVEVIAMLWRLKKYMLQKKGRFT